MLRGIYTSASGMLTETIRSDVTANNLANINTSGYKKDVAIQQDFSKLLVKRINDGQQSLPPLNQMGELGTGASIVQIATIHETGSIRETGGEYDFAIMGQGFFAVETPQGVRYTRNGSFTRNPQGELVTSEGFRVLGQRGPIRLGQEAISVGDNGQITSNGQVVDTLRIANFANLNNLRKEGASLYAAQGNAQEVRPQNFSVRQKSLETANVNSVAEMVNLISVFRAYEANSKAVSAQDELLGKAVNDVGRL